MGGRDALLGWRSGTAATAAVDEIRATCTAYVEAVSHGNLDVLRRLRSADAVTDFVHGDAFGSGSLDSDGAERVWGDWFHAFPEQRLQVARTLLGPTVASMEWTFTVHHLGELRPPIVAEVAPPSGRRATFRGVTVLDIGGGLIRRETVYLDYVTLLVALGIGP